MATCHMGCHWKTRSFYVGKTQTNTSSARCNPWPCMSKPCSHCRKKAQSRLITEITLGRRQKKLASKKHSKLRDLLHNIIGRIFVMAAVRLAWSDWVAAQKA